MEREWRRPPLPAMDPEKDAVEFQQFEADYTVGDMKLWLKVNKSMKDSDYDLVGPKGVWKMGAGSEVLKDDQAHPAPPPPRSCRSWTGPNRTTKTWSHGASAINPTSPFSPPITPSTQFR